MASDVLLLGGFGFWRMFFRGGGFGDIGYRDGKRRTFVEIARELQLGMEQPGQLERDVEAETGAAGGARPEVFRPEELVIYPLSVAFADTDTGIAYVKSDFVLTGFDPKLYVAFFGVFYGVGNKIL